MSKCYMKVVFIILIFRCMISISVSRLGEKLGNSFSDNNLISGTLITVHRFD